MSRTVMHYGPWAAPRNEHLRAQIKERATEHQPLALPDEPKHCWSIAVVNKLGNGRHLTCLTIVDDFTKEVVDSAVDHGVSGLYVARALDLAVRFRALPITTGTDQDPEFSGKALDQWAYEHMVELRRIEADNPTQIVYIERFDGKFRDECVNGHWFRSLSEARATITAWKRDYDQQRPPMHWNVGYQQNSSRLGAQDITEPPSTSNNDRDNLGLCEICHGPK